MSLLKAMYSGASGLGAYKKAISVVADNISNINTVGFKANRARFEEVLGNSASGSSSDGGVGQGVRLGGVDASFVQGSLIGSRVATDMAIQGDGFFIVKGAFDGVEDASFYSRNGQFHVDEHDQLVNFKGLVLQGYPVDETSDDPKNPTYKKNLEGLEISSGTLQPRQTEGVSMKVNLDATSEAPPGGFVLGDASTSNYVTTVTIFDSLGAEHNLNVHFTKLAGGSWEWNAVAKGAELPGGSDEVILGGTLQYDTNGLLVAAGTNQSDNTAAFINANPGQIVDMNFGSATPSEGSSQFSSPSTVSSMQVDGFAAAAMAGITVEGDGTLVGTFTNGERRPIAALALARFVNNGGLVRRDAGHWAESVDSGQALVGRASEGGRGSIVGNTLEQSTVDLAHEFVNIITYQRAFQANSRAIKTANELLQEVARLA